MQTLIQYKRRIASRFIPLEGASALRELPEAESFTYSEKIDGHLGFAVVEAGQVRFYNRSGTALALGDLAPHFPAAAEGIWAGELYVPQNRSRAFLVSSAVANEGQGLHFAVFDAVHALELPLAERMALVAQHIPQGPRVHPVAWKTSDSRKDILAHYEEAIAAGKEGLIVIPQHGAGYKLKPQVELDVAVLGYSMKEDGSGIRSLLVGVLNGQGQWQVVASVGGGFSEEDRLAWLQRLEPLQVQADILLVAKNRLAYQWVRPELVVQIKCLEILSEDASGAILKDVLDYTPEGGYSGAGKIAGVSLVSPAYLHTREDKTPGATDTGLNQISDRIEISPPSQPGAPVEAHAPAAAAGTVTSQILSRRVFTKSGKNGLAVRKFIGVQTHREASGLYPAYYAFFTDFSAGRKEPLQTEIHVAADAAALQAHLQALEAENIKKGWTLVPQP